MADESTLDQIKRLADEEHALRHKESQGGATDDDRARLRELDVMLDQCWDLLRQRRAKRAAGRDPDEATVRDSATVEHYRQ